MTLQERFESNYEIVEPGGCWVWMAGLDHYGYGAIRVNGRVEKTHRVSYKIQHGEIPSSLCVLHRCDVRCCVNPSHLFLGTRAHNQADMKAKGRGRGARGEASGKAKLTDLQVIEIRALYGALSYSKIASRFGVSGSQIGAIVRGEQRLSPNQERDS